MRFIVEPVDPAVRVPDRPIEARSFRRQLVSGVIAYPSLAADAGNSALLIDLSGVEYVSSVGLRVLMIAANAMRARNARIAVCGLRPIVAEIFGISRFDALLDVHPSFETALAKLSPAALEAWRSTLAR